MSELNVPQLSEIDLQPSLYPLASDTLEPEWSSSSSSSPNGDFRLLLILFVAFRLLALFLLRPGGFVRDWSDFNTYLGIATVSDYGLYPFLHYWLEWPPLVPWLVVGAYRLSLLIPVWPDDHRLWFVLILGGVFALFEAGNLVLLFRLAHQLYGARARSGLAAGVPRPHHVASLARQVTRPVWLYALLFVPLYTMLGFFDGIALFFLLLALYLLLKARWGASAVAVGLGFMTKLVPLILVPVALKRTLAETSSWRPAIRYGLVCVLTIAAIAAPFLATQPHWLVASGRAIAGRSSWETVWAVLEGYFGYGVVAGDRLNPAETNFADYPDSLPWWLISLLFGLFYLIVWTRPADMRQPRVVVALTGFTLTLLVLYSKGYSPQFLVYLLPFILLLFPDGRGIAYSLLLTVLNVLEQPVYFVLVPDAHWLLTGVVIGRALVWLALLFEFGFIVWADGPAHLMPVRRYLVWALCLLVGLGTLVSLPLLGSSYAQHQLENEPAGPLIGYLMTGQARAQSDQLLIDDQALLRRLTPYLGHSYRLYLIGGEPRYLTHLALGERLVGARCVWLLTSRPGGQAAPGPVDEWGPAHLTYHFANGYRLKLFCADGDRPAPLARLANGVQLIGYRVEQPSRNHVSITLYWWAVNVPAQDYTVFTQVLDENGRFVSGHDGTPVGGSAPTHAWQAGHVYADTHLIELGGDLPAGRYRAVAGMYDAIMTRVGAQSPDGQPWPDDAIDLATIALP